jgi:hypothetical protein
MCQIHSEYGIGPVLLPGPSQLLERLLLQNHETDNSGMDLAIMSAVLLRVLRIMDIMRKMAFLIAGHTV